MPPVGTASATPSSTRRSRAASSSASSPAIRRRRGPRRPASSSRRGCRCRSTTSARTPRSRCMPKPTAAAYVTLLALLAEAGLASRAEVSVKLSAVGQALDRSLASTTPARICVAAIGGRDDGHPRHGGPHHDRRHPGDVARAARRLPMGRRGCAVLPASYRGGLPRPRRRPDRASGSARARTRSPSRVAFQRGATMSTRPTCVASRS